MGFRLGAGSTRNLQGVHPNLVAPVRLAIQYTTQDFCIIEGGGLRRPDQAAANAKAGTGILNSMHLPQADGFSHAVDLVAYEDGKPTWGDGSLAESRRLYMPIRNAMIRACDELGVLIQHGADWDVDGILGEPGEWDWPHFQFPKLPARISAAKKAMEERMGKASAR